MLFFNFCLFPFSKFQMTIVKNIRHKYFWSTHFWQRNGSSFKFLWYLQMHFVSSFFLNEWNITTSLLMIHLKRTVVHYSKLHSSSINKPFFNYGPLNLLFLFFFISYLLFYANFYFFEGGGGVKLHFLKFFTSKSILLWPTQIKEFSRKSYPPFNYHPLILWNFLVKLSSAKWKSWVRTKWENCSEHKQS